MGKTIDAIEKYDINGTKHGCHVKIRYLWAKTLMS